MQPGPIYFLTPRKCAVFGVYNEGEGSQLFYLIDDSTVATKGAHVAVLYLPITYPATLHPSIWFYMPTTVCEYMYKYTYLQVYNISSSSLKLVYMHMNSRPAVTHSIIGNC